MDIQIKIQCPCCHGPVDPHEHPGIVSNKIASIGSQLVSLKEQVAKLANRKPSPLLTAVEINAQRDKAKEQIESLTKEQKIWKALQQDIDKKRGLKMSNTNKDLLDELIAEGIKTDPKFPEAVAQALENREAARDEVPVPVLKPTIEFADWAKIELRAGTIVEAEAVPKSELLKLNVSFGPLGNRTILARIGSSFDPNAVKGRQIIAILNLAPRKMKGIESQGMLLAAERSDGVLALMQPGAIVPDGAEVG